MKVRLSLHIPLIVGACLGLTACSDDDPIADGTAGSGGAAGSGSTVSSFAEAVVLWDSCVQSDDGVQTTLNNAYYERRAAANPNLISHALVSRLVGKPATCEGAFAAAGASVETTTEECGPTCAGDTMVACDGGIKYTLDCGLVFGVGCADGMCAVNPSGQPCDNDTFVPSCEGGRPLVCTDETTPGLVCADYGLTCVADDIGLGPDASCVGTGPACEEGQGSSLEHNYLWNPIACADGGSLRMCVNGFEHAADCTEVATGFACFAFGGSSFCGKGAECNPGDDAFCDGDAVVLCDAGKVVRVECSRLGFSTCNPTKTLCG